MVMDLYGTELLTLIQSTYQARFQKALERGYDQQGNRYYWLYDELHIRLQTIREAILFLDALPKFLNTAEDDKMFEYVISFVMRYFSHKSIGATDDPEGHNPFFQDQNPYWQDFQEAMDALNEPVLLQSLPLFFVYSSELVVRAIRLYFQIREAKFHAIDRGNFDGLMQSGVTCGPAQQAG